MWVFSIIPLSIQLVKGKLIMKYENVVIACPYKAVSGGPELAHQLCSLLNNNNISSYMYYYDDNGKLMEDVAPERYKKYNTQALKNDDIQLLNHSCTAIVIPEVAIALKQLFPDCIHMYWWMSVDNYLSSYATNISNHGTKDPFRLLDEKDALHLVQSAYAKDFLLTTLHIEENLIYPLSDYIGETFLTGPKIAPEFKQPFIAYNPKKGFDTLKPIIDKTPELTWFPIINMNAEDVGNLLRLAKIYIDFGGHPGKDRIPREAAYSGCCIITNQKGSAAYFDDVAIPDNYKFEDPTKEQEEIIDLIKDILINFSSHSANFDDYRHRISIEKETFEKEAMNLFDF